MKVYIFHPAHHGPCTFTVGAESEDRAKAAVDNHVDLMLSQGMRYECSGWREGEYRLEVHDLMSVAEHDND